MATLVAAANPLVAAVSVTVNWSDTPAVTGVGIPVRVFRVTPDTTSTEVLGSPVILSRGLAVFWDTTAPLGVSVSYRATTTPISTVLTSSTVTVTGTAAGWLKDPVQPVNDISFDACPGGCPGSGTGVSFLSLGPGEFTTATGVFPIVDAPRPRTVSQRRKARTSVLGIESHSITSGLGVEDILGSGRNLLLQLVSRYGWASREYGSDYITVGDTTETRPPTADMRRPQRNWSLPFGLARPPYVQTGRTAGNGVGVRGITYSAATATGRTYTTRTSGKTYLQSALGQNI